MLEIAAGATTGLVFGAFIGTTSELISVLCWGLGMLAVLGTGTWRLLRARRSWPNTLAGLRLAERDRIRIAITKATNVPQLPGGLRPIAIDAAGRADHVRSACAPWFAAGAAAYVGGVLVRAIVEPEVSSFLNLTLGTIVVGGQWIHVAQWRQARRVMVLPDASSTHAVGKTDI